VRDRGFGFIRDEGGQEWFFHRSSVTDGAFGKYCSEHCREAADQTELMCDCKHPGCR
jgi:hypothetical protein